MYEFLNHPKTFSIHTNTNINHIVFSFVLFFFTRKYINKYFLFLNHNWILKIDCFKKIPIFSCSCIPRYLLIFWIAFLERRPPLCISPIISTHHVKSILSCSSVWISWRVWKWFCFSLLGWRVIFAIKIVMGERKMKMKQNIIYNNPFSTILLLSFPMLLKLMLMTINKPERRCRWFLARWKGFHLFPLTQFNFFSLWLNF